MLDMDEITVSSDVNYGFRMEKIGNYIRIYGTSTRTGISFFSIADSNQNYLYGKGFVFSWFTNEPNVISVYGLRTVSEKKIAIQMNLQEGQVYDFTIQIALGVQKLTAYEPYRGQTYTIQLGQTVYGGTVDAVTGALTVTQVEIESYNGENLPGQWISDRDIYTPGTQPSIGAQVVYALAESQTIKLAPQQITALPGTNTIYTDAGNITVTGASDPIATITALQDRVSALESAQTNL